jgi:hypothetical protein
MVGGVAVGIYAFNRLSQTTRYVLGHHLLTVTTTSWLRRLALESLCLVHHCPIHTKV